MTKEQALEILVLKLKELKDSVSTDTSNAEALEIAIISLKQEPKTGHWINMDEGFSPCVCSECKSVEFKESKYCPNCGCLMVESQESEK